MFKKLKIVKIWQYREQYQRSSWNKVFGFPKLEKNGSMSHNGVAKSVKEKPKSFNIVLYDLCCVPSSLFVFDVQLR